jgi:hypothetical protein
MMRSKSMEDPHVLSSRNFAFSVDEIYNQAYQSHVRSSPIPFSSSGGLSPFWLGDCGIIRGVLIAGCPPVELYECGTKYPCGH